MEPVKQRPPIIDIPGDESLSQTPGPNSVSIGTNSHTDYSQPPVAAGSTDYLNDLKHKKVSRGEFLSYGLGGLLTLTGVGAIYEALKGEHAVNLAKAQYEKGYSGLLAQIGDVTINSPSNGDVLSYNTLYKSWVNSPQYLKNNTDVSILSPKNKQVLTYDSSSGKWTNTTPSLSLNSDVALSSPSDSEVLTYDATTSSWTNKSLPPNSTAVSSVNNQTGAVAISAAGIGALAAVNDLSDLTNAGTARTNLGLGSAATHNATNFDAAGAATAAQDASLQKANNLSDIDSASTARSNLGLGTAATHPATDFLETSNNLSDLSSASTARSNLGLGSSATENAGVASGVATLDGTGNVPVAQLGNVPANVRYRGAWAANTVYAIDDSVTNNGGFYVCNTAHTSGSSFAGTDWTQLSAPNGTYVQVVKPSGDMSGVSDASAIQAVLNGGSNVQLQAATYYVNATLVVPAGLGIVGGGMYATTVKAANGSNLIAVIADAAWYNNATQQQNGGLYRDLTIDGNMSNQTTYGINNQAGGHGLISCAFRTFVQRVYFTNNPVDGYVQSDINKSGSTLSNENVECHVRDCWADSNGRDGFHILFNSSLHGNTDGWLKDNVSFNNGRWNFNLETCAGWFISGNHAWTTSSSSAVMAHGFNLGQVWGSFIWDNEVDTFGSQTFGATTDSSASASNGSTTVTLPTIGNKYLDRFSITGTNIPANTVILKALGSNQYQISQATTGAVTSATVTPNYSGLFLGYFIQGRPSSCHNNQCATAEYVISANYNYFTFSVAGASTAQLLVLSGNSARRDTDRSVNQGAGSIGYTFIAPAGSSMNVSGLGNVTKDGVLTTYQTGGGGTFTFLDAQPGTSLSATYEPFSGVGYYEQLPTTLTETMNPNAENSAVLAPSSGDLDLTYFTPNVTRASTGFTLESGASAASGLTTCQVGLYSVTSNGNLNLVASIASDTTLFASTFTAYSRTWQSPVQLQAGQQYAFAVLQVGTTIAQLRGQGNLSPLAAARSPRICATILGQSSLPASITSGQTTTRMCRVYAQC